MVAYQEIQNTLLYIEEHIAEPLDIKALAAKAYLSPYYFQRLFTRLVGRPIAEYQKQRRLARTIELLKTTDARIIDIAMQLGFTNPETYTRAFKSAFNVTPDEYRRDGYPWPGNKLNPVLMPDVTLAFTLINEGVPLISEGIVMEFSRRTYTEDRLYAGFRVNCTHGTPNDMNPGVTWDYFVRRKETSLPHLHPQGHNAGISIGNETGFTYTAASLVTRKEPAFTQTRSWPGFDALPEYLTLDYVSIPAGEYLICTFTAEDFGQLVEDALHKAMNYIWGTFIPKHKLSVDGPYIELYDERSLRWHPVNPVREGQKTHFAPCEPKLSQWEGPEIEIQTRLAKGASKSC